MPRPAAILVEFRERLPGLVRAAAMLALGLSPGLACKSKLEQSCRCSTDCRDGLLCVIEVNSATIIPNKFSSNFSSGP